MNSILELGQSNILYDQILCILNRFLPFFKSSSFLSKPKAYVFNVLSIALVAMYEIEELSIPPDKNAPTSTSAFILFDTDFSNNSLSFSLEVVVSL